MTDEVRGISRRDLLKRGAVLGGTIAWVTPVVQVVGMSPALAQVPSFEQLFFDDFLQEDADLGGADYILNFTSFDFWTVSDGTVDLLKDGTIFGINVVSSGNYVDLDGSSGNAGVMTTTQVFNFSPGDYRLTLRLAGNHRNGAGETVTAVIQNGLPLFPPVPLTRLQNDPFTDSVIDFTVAVATTGAIVLDHAGGDNVGLLLDSVKLERVS